MGSFSIWHWLVVLIIVLLIFGTKKLRNIGSDLGGAIKSFKQAMKEDEGQAKPEAEEEAEPEPPKKIAGKSGRIIDAEVTSKQKHKS